MRIFSLHHLFPLVLVASFVIQCSENQTSNQPFSITEPVLDSCKFEPDHHYMVTIPENPTKDELFPLILVIDPHGDGKLGTEKFTRALKDIPAVVAGSEKIRNNYPDFERSLSNLEQDVFAKYPADPEKVIVAGFSGGARMAYYFGLHHEVMGIIMYGAGPDRNAGSPDNKRLSLVTGTRDFNFMEQYIPPFSDRGQNREQMTDYFRGTHEWPPANNIRESVAFILKDDPQFPGIIPKQISETELTEYDSLLEANDLFFAAKSLEKAWLFSGEKKQKALIASTIEKFKMAPGWNRSIRTFEEYLKNEISLKQSYIANLTNPDTAWWSMEIRNLNQKIISGSDPEMVDFLYRLEGFIGIILYSRINSILKNGQHTDELDRLLFIYELAEPESPDLVKFIQQVKQLS